MQQLANVQDAINFEIEGLNKVLSDKELLEYRHIDEVIRNLEAIKSGKLPSMQYLNIMPIQVLYSILVGQKFTNNYGAECTIKNIGLSKFGKKLLTVETNDPKYKKNKIWDMYLVTLLKEKHILSNPNINEKYFKWINKSNVESYIDKLLDKKDKYNEIYKTCKSKQESLLAENVNQYTNKAVVTREAIKRAKSDIRKDATFIQDAWNGNLSEVEKTTLMNWIKDNVYSMRLWVLKDGAYDQAISELFPDNIYGLKRRGEASEKSIDHIGGYISFNSIDNAPFDIISKITNKVDKSKHFKKEQEGNKYRLNNYRLVLYILQNYNHLGYKTGIRNLNKVLA